LPRVLIAQASIPESVKSEAPLYLFDPQFAEKAPELLKDYQVPEYWNEDLFSVLGNSRPDYRWLIIGPAGSGSSFHQDPNRTSAWNALLTGHKKWLLYPPTSTPPGVERDSDGDAIVLSDSVIEWYATYYEEAVSQAQLIPKNATEHLRPIECIQGPGETIFVPGGWWHMVLNLDETIAVTQNYVSSQNFYDVFEYLKTNDEMNYLFQPFVDKLKEVKPLLVEMAEQKIQSCIYTKYGKQFSAGVYFHCFTCCPSRQQRESMACCTACAFKCHKDHILSSARLGRFYCDCGDGQMLHSTKCANSKMDRKLRSTM